MHPRYLRLLREGGGINEEVFVEMQALQQLRFDFRDKQASSTGSTFRSLGGGNTS